MEPCYPPCVLKKVFEDKELLYALTKLIDKYEQHPENSVSVEKMSSKTMKQIHIVVGFSIVTSKIQTAYKLSQIEMTLLPYNYRKAKKHKKCKLNSHCRNNEKNETIKYN